MRIFQNSSNKAIRLRVKILTTADNTVYTMHFLRPSFGYAETSYMPELVRRNRLRGGKIQKIFNIFEIGNYYEPKGD
jgi:hypothetical protein